MIRCLIVLLALAPLVLHTGQSLAQDASPDSGLQDEACKRGFAPLRQAAEARGKLIRAASERHAPPAEACKLIGDFVQSEIRIIKYIEANSANCAIPPEVADRLRAGHKNTEAMQEKVCAAAQGGEPAGPVGDFDAPSLVR